VAVWLFFVLGSLALVGLLCGLWSQDSGPVDRGFTGTVTGRSVKAHTLTTGMRYDHLLFVRGDDGQEFTVRVDSGVYGSFAVGDGIVKAAGARHPAKRPPGATWTA
jgi:hypothetical protein